MITTNKREYNLDLSIWDPRATKVIALCDSHTYKRTVSFIAKIDIAFII